MRHQSLAQVPILAALVFMAVGCDSSTGESGDGDTSAEDAIIAPGEDSFEPAEDTTAPGEDTTEPAEDTSEPEEDSVEPPEDIHEGPCPPLGPFGTEQGDIVKDAVLIDCDGVEHSIHELCETKVTWIFSFAGW